MPPTSSLTLGQPLCLPETIKVERAEPARTGSSPRKNYFRHKSNQMCLAMLNKLMNIKVRPSQDLQEYFLQGEIYRREVKDGGKAILDSMWKNVLVEDLTFKYENIKLIAYHDSAFTLEQNQDTTHKYYVDDLCVRGKGNIAGRGAAIWVGQT